MKRYMLILTLVALLAGCAQTKQKAAQGESVKTVFVVMPRQKNQNEYRIFDGAASSSAHTKLSFKVQGNVNYFKFKIGDEVKKGELIAKMDPVPFELKISQISFALKEARAVAKSAKSEFERVKKLYVNQNASASDIDNAKALYESSEAKTQNIARELEYAKLQLSYASLYAPQDGFISDKYIDESENVAAGAPIVLISDKNIDEVKVRVSENFINLLSVGDLAQVRFESLDKDKIYEAAVSEISKFASNDTKTYQVTLKLKDSSQEIKAGMSASVSFKNSDQGKNNILIVPSNSLLNDNGGYYVYVLVKDGQDYKTVRRNVTVGKLTKNGYEILSGLSADSLVLKAGMSQAYENMRAQIGNLKDLGM